jgi:hypothetical protein
MAVRLYRNVDPVISLRTKASSPIFSLTLAEFRYAANRYSHRSFRCESAIAVAAHFKNL